MLMAAWGIVKFKLCRGWQMLSAPWHLVYLEVNDEI